MLSRFMGVLLHFFPILTDSMPVVKKTGKEQWPTVFSVGHCYIIVLQW